MVGTEKSLCRICITEDILFTPHQAIRVKDDGGVRVLGYRKAHLCVNLHGITNNISRGCRTQTFGIDFQWQYAVRSSGARRTRFLRLGSIPSKTRICSRRPIGRCYCRAYTANVYVVRHVISVPGTAAGRFLLFNFYIIYFLSGFFFCFEI